MEQFFCQCLQLAIKSDCNSLYFIRLDVYEFNHLFSTIKNIVLFWFFSATLSVLVSVISTVFFSSVPAVDLYILSVIYFVVHLTVDS